MFTSKLNCTHKFNCPEDNHVADDVEIKCAKCGEPKKHHLCKGAEMMYYEKMNRGVVNRPRKIWIGKVGIPL